MRVASVDIGTNTVLLLVAERGADGQLVAVEERATITRLGQGVDKTRRLAPEAIARTNAALDAYADVIEKAGATRVDVVGTSAMRDAGGGEEVRAHVKARLGVEARTISGDEEARLTFAGALSGLGAIAAGTKVRVFDIGGGSTEIVHGERGSTALLYAHSYDVGSVRLTERHVSGDPPSPAELDAVRAAARAAFAGVPAFASDVPPVGIAGTMTTLAAVSLEMSAYDGARVHGLTLSVSEIERVVAELARVPLAERARLPGLEPKRADVIVAGGLVALAYLEHAGADAVTISDRGVRWGLAEELVRASRIDT
ncbi:MAG: Ppx/GppA family phosphatase [Labilithrix sp.]|nr:Ppx/GppA family phosphatase [Labilithrix sp.]MCW5810448.1 Ppx/GppA family phosphatase [Labilithrix sp.]